MADKLALLSRLNLFDEMSEEEIAGVSRQLRMRELSPGTSIGGEPDRVYLVKTGRVRLYRLTSAGDDVTTATLNPGQLFGLAALEAGTGRASLAEALEISVICDAGAQDFVSLLARHPLLMAKVLVAMARQMFRLEETVESLVLDSVGQRLAKLLLGWLPGAEHVADGDLLPPHTQEEMAKLVTATRETVARTLSAWRAEGMLRNDGRRILILDAGRLAAKADGR
ncbi:MAG: Crp/Fnr family transcriptional regulator [Candidatus Dormibacteraeota bacterium]|nr:Crp/Fnr family transcriptional regulator [Candidatus Dormibacteraeota bacterium]